MTTKKTKTRKPQTRVKQRKDGSIDITFGKSKREQSAALELLAALSGQTVEEAFPNRVKKDSEGE